MKKIITIISLFIAFKSYSQAPQLFNYQGVARDNAGAPMVSKTICLRLSILDNSSSGNILYMETHAVSTNQLGLFTAAIGGGSAVQGTFATVSWASANSRWLKVEMDDKCNSNYTVMGTSQFLSVPYAMYAEKSGSSLSAGNGISISGGIVTNTAPDKIVTIVGNNLTVSGSYPNFTITNPVSSGSDKYWKFDGNSLSYNDTSNNKRIEIVKDNNLTEFTINDSNNRPGIRLITSASGSSTGAALFNYPTNGNTYTYVGGDNDGGKIRLYNESGQTTMTMWNTSNNEGQIQLYDSNYTKIAEMGPINTGEGGGFWGFSNTGSRLTKTTSLINYPQNGGFAVCDYNSSEQAGLYVDKWGDGIIWGDTKSFRMKHPIDSTKEIWYACVEGPEAAAYIRGTSKLTNGKALVVFPEHFNLVKGNNSYTVILTPISGKSKGLAVEIKNLDGFEVLELFNGDGNYEFDWEVKAVRINHENYQVIRKAGENTLATPASTPKR